MRRNSNKALSFGSGARMRRRAGKRSAPQTAEELTTELYTHVKLALDEFGVTRVQQQRALKRSARLKSAPKVSGRILCTRLGVAEILSEWSRKAPYLDSDGKPRVLSIAGPGATFESLARRFLPTLPVKEVVALACENAEVATRPGNRIALLGSILVKLGDSHEKYLAHAIRQIDQLLQTLLHNWHVRHDNTGSGRMERTVTGIISRSNFAAFMTELRPQIYDLLLRVDSSIERTQPRTARSRRAASAVSVSVCVGQEDDLERAGVDTSLVPIAKTRATPNKRLRSSG